MAMMLMYHISRIPPIFDHKSHFVALLLKKHKQQKRKPPSYLLQCFKTWTKLMRHQISFSLPAFVLVNLLTLITQVLHFYLFTILHFIFSVLSHTFTQFKNFLYRFTVFIVLLYLIISQRFLFYTSKLFTHSYDVMVSFTFFVFVRHTAHCFLLLVSCMLYVVKKIALRKPTWIGGQNVSE